jgi:hypothetical protein
MNESQNVKLGDTVLYVIPTNKEAKPCIVTHIHEGTDAIDAVLFNNTSTGEYANLTILTNVRFNESETTPKTWHFRKLQEFARSATRDSR